jgi:hypothetical protein
MTFYDVNVASKVIGKNTLKKKLFLVAVLKFTETKIAGSGSATLVDTIE